MRRSTLLLLTALLALLALAPSAQAAFGVEEFALDFEDPGGTEATQAGSHPFAVTNRLALNTEVDPDLGEIPQGALRDLEVALPEGLVGNPNATPQCASDDFIDIDFKTKLPNCSDDMVVGVVSVRLLYNSNGPAYASAPVYNIAPPFGVVQKLGFSAAGVPVTIEFKLNPKPPYNVSANLRYIAQPLPIIGSRLTIWGNPADPAHDEERGSCIETLPELTDEIHTKGGDCPSTAPETAFVTSPRACRGPLPVGYAADSWQAPGIFDTGAIQTPAFDGCETLDFTPTIDSKTTSASAESPSGLNFDLDIKDPGLTDPAKNAQSDIKKAVVTLPEGVTTNPAVASGLGACTLAQYNSETVNGAPGTGCPESAKVGSVEIQSPLVKPIINGALYVAKQGDNPYNNLLTVYMVAKSPELGVIVQAAGKVDPDPVTGQLTTTFDELPQLPFNHFRLHFREGQRAPLITPAGCGKYTTTALLYPYANPTVARAEAASFEINSGCGSPQNQESFAAGTVDPKAGSYSPFSLELSRPDGSQRLSAITAALPEGLLGKLAGIPYCSDARIAAAAARTGQGQGALELASPSCPQASEVGVVNVGAGAGTEPLYVTGRAYLAGPYKGAPLSLAIITPAIAGPFDLGTVVVRTALQVDLKSAQITAVSDPLPTILHGLPLDVRSVAINMTRPKFTLNPTSCEPKQITATALSTLGQSVVLSQYFQASQCAKLKFAPKLALSLKGATRRSGHPALRAVLTYPKGSYANIARAQVGLPHSEFLDQGSIGTVCTQPQLKSGTCPKASIYGHAKAFSPLLDKPLSGPVYLGVGYGHTLPDLVADLDGQIRVLLNGKVDTTKQDGIRNTFEAVPDAPVSKFVIELKGGPKKGLLENSENICLKEQSANAKFIGQNGKAALLRVPIANDCGKKKGKGGR